MRYWLPLALPVRRLHKLWRIRPLISKQDATLPQFVPTVPPTPNPSHPLLARFWGHVHFYLRIFSLHYTHWTGKSRPSPGLWPLPFGLILKWSDGTRLEEVLTMRVAKAGGLPVPKVICYGEHPKAPWAPVSILMTHLPGMTLGEVYHSLFPAQRQAILQELKEYLGRMRRWRRPIDKICTVAGTSIRSVRVPKHLVGPCDNEKQFTDYLLSTANSGMFSSETEFEAAVQSAKLLGSKLHSIVFTHGDLMHHNILVHDGHVSGIIDWEASGWLPEYWEYTTAWRMQSENKWWFQFVKELAHGMYLEELEYERSLMSLTLDSYL